MTQHWVSKHAEDHEACSACGQKVPNACDPGITVLITGSCKGPPALPSGQHLVCATCRMAPGFLGKYELVELERHGGFCEMCGRFVGDDYYVVHDPRSVKNSRGRVTSAPAYGIWCVPPDSNLEHTCADAALEIATGVAQEGACPACADRTTKYGVERFASLPRAPYPLPWAFGTEQAAQQIIDIETAEAGPALTLMGSEWTYEVRLLTHEGS